MQLHVLDWKISRNIITLKPQEPLGYSCEPVTCWYQLTDLYCGLIFRDESEPATIIDEDAVIPDGWLLDEEVYIPDPAAVKPDDW